MHSPAGSALREPRVKPRYACPRERSYAQRTQAGHAARADPRVAARTQRPSRTSRLWGYKPNAKEATHYGLITAGSCASASARCIVRGDIARVPWQPAAAGGRADASRQETAGKIGAGLTLLRRGVYNSGMPADLVRRPMGDMAGMALEDLTPRDDADGSAGGAPVGKRTAPAAEKSIPPSALPPSPRPG